jgi:hypothetical protein
MPSRNEIPHCRLASILSSPHSQSQRFLRLLPFLSTAGFLEFLPFL